MPELFYFLSFLQSDRLTQISFDFRTFKQKCHYYIEHIICLKQSSLLTFRQFIHPIDLAQYCHHTIYKPTHLIHNCREIIFGKCGYMSKELAVYGSEETHACMLLEEMCPLKQQTQSRGVFLYSSLCAVNDVYLHYYRLVSLHIIHERLTLWLDLLGK